MAGTEGSFHGSIAKLREHLAKDPELAARFDTVRRFSGKVRAAEYHLTNVCNIRCRGCWFFECDFDKRTTETKSLKALREFVLRERSRGINSALLIGGEPTLFPERIRAYVENMEYVTISSNGLRKLPREGFENVTVAITLFGGGPLDDELRAYKPSGARFTGLFDTALANYRGDERAGFVYAVTESGIDYIEDTVRRIEDNGNRVTFNFYSQYHKNNPLQIERERQLVDELLRVRERHPRTVTSHPYYIRVMVSGRADWGTFGYDVCPSISADHPAHRERLRNGNPTLPRFNTYAPDLETVHFCCTSGHCEDCRDSQAVSSWLMASPHKFFGSAESLRTWIEMAELYWSQFIWSPFHPLKHGEEPAARATGSALVSPAEVAR